MPYVNKEILTEEMIICQKENKVSEDLEKMFNEILDQKIEHIKKHKRLKNEEDYEIAREAAYNHCLKMWDKFKPELLKNGFAYISQIYGCSFAQTIVKLNKERNGSSCQKS